jgi:hypothetical protein
VILEGSAIALPSVLLSMRGARAFLQLGAAPLTFLELSVKTITCSLPDSLYAALMDSRTVPGRWTPKSIT